MSIEVKVSATSIEELADKLLALGSKLSGGAAPIRGAAAEAAAEPEKPKRTRKAAEGNAVQSDNPGQLQNATGEASSAAEPAEVSASAPLNFDADVAPLVIKLVGAKGRETVTGILSQFGAGRASEVDEARWPELIELLNAAL